MATSRALAPFETTVFTVFSDLARRHDAVNLGQGFPDFDGPAWIQDAARDAMRRGHNQYAPSHGTRRLREAVVRDTRTRLGITYDADREVTVTSGATEGIAAAILGLLDPGDDVVTFEPFYDSYPACAALAGARLRAVPLRPPAFRFDPDELRAAFTEKTRMVILNTPHNPTGRVFTRAECEEVVALCREHDCWLLTDEVYEHLTFGDHAHLSPATLDRDRTIRVSSAAKTFSLTGWKVGWVCAPEVATEGLRRAHQFLVFCTATPLQHAIAAALDGAPDRGYYDEFRAGYATRRALLLDGLRAAGFEAFAPEGTYFAMARHPDGPCADAFVRRLIEQRRVAAIPPESFYEHEEEAGGLVRFAFCKSEATLREGIRRMVS